MTDKPKTISKEAAKLLGVPFQWRTTYVLRYVRTPKDVAVERYHENRWERIGDESALDYRWSFKGGDPEIREKFDDRLKENQS